MNDQGESQPGQPHTAGPRRHLRRTLVLGALGALVVTAIVIAVAASLGQDQPVFAGTRLDPPRPTTDFQLRDQFGEDAGR